MKNDLSTVGLYVWTDTPDQHDFWKHCGINMLQVCDIGWYRNSNTLLDPYLDSMAEQINNMKKDGFSVNVILFSTIQQWEGPGDFEPTRIGEKFHPSDKLKMEKRLKYIEKSIMKLSMADGFTLFAGDPGGVTAELGAADHSYYTEMGREVLSLIKLHAPGAYFNFNPWAVTMFPYPEVSCEEAKWWLKESEITSEIISQENLIGEEIGIELPCHDYYRAMALERYHREGYDPKFPSIADIRTIKDKNTKRIWAWPYFILDEADDGDTNGGVVTDLTQSETRYIYKFVGDMSNLNGINGIIGNWSYKGYLSKSMNTYAFGRFVNDPSATPESVMKEYAGNVTTASSSDLLVEIMKYIENNSNWQRKLPPTKRLPDFETDIRTASDALKRFDEIKVNEQYIPGRLPETPGDYLARIKSRLIELSAHGF